jgi:hypothetical protein
MENTAMKKTTVLLLTLLAVAALALPASAGTKGSWTGWITDTSCGAKGANADHKDCAAKCAARGDKLVLFNAGDKKLYALDNQNLAKENIGHEVKVTGEVSGAAIKVESISTVEAGKVGV